MNRRDTIIIAVLLNAGLLIVLFATSVKSDKTEETVPTTVLSSNQPEIQSTPASVAAAPIAPAGADQLDQVIQQYVTPQVTGQTIQTETGSNFLADLQALGTDQAAPVMAPVMERAPAIVEMQAAEPALREVKVKKGDVLEKIARQNNVSVSDIMKVNKLSSTRLKIGQILKMPGKSAKASIATASGDNAQYYTIKNGDNPWTIAVKHHMKVDELLKLNNMNEDKARRLKPGDRIRIQ
ncbi:MAG TPA: LysM peptidoglycan-binding domain-containing protein [Rhabdochlamydiaceae bacterium]|nr:LysM peptidoglycan-binding domain-containing protein [Rhabdochlamydiaceae bacterium]